MLLLQIKKIYIFLSINTLKIIFLLFCIFLLLPVVCLVFLESVADCGVSCHQNSVRTYCGSCWDCAEEDGVFVSRKYLGFSSTRADLISLLKIILLDVWRLQIVPKHFSLLSTIIIAILFKSQSTIDDNTQKWKINKRGLKRNT